MDSLEKFVREHTNIAVAVYDQRLNPTDSNLAFRNTFKERSSLSLSDLVSHMVSGDDFLSQMMMIVEVEKARGSCTMAYNTEDDRREFRVELFGTRKTAKNATSAPSVTSLSSSSFRRSSCTVPTAWSASTGTPRWACSRQRWGETSSM